MSSVTSSGVMGGVSQQASRLALLEKLFTTTGKPAQDSKNKPAQGAAPPPPPPPPPPAQTNSAAGLASMYEALQSQDNASVSDLLSRLLQAVDTDGDGAISADELHAVTELTEAPPQSSGPALTSGDSGASVFVDPMAAGTTKPTTAYEALFQALQLVFAQADTGLGSTGSLRYADALQSLANAG